MILQVPTSILQYQMRKSSEITVQVLPKVIPAGKIHCTVELLRNNKDIILMGDAKLVTKGLNNNFSGDVNLLGHETNPNLENLKKYMDRKFDFISECVHKFSKSETCDRFNILSDLTDWVTEMNQRVRSYTKSENQKLGRYMSGNYPTKPKKAVSACKTNIYTSSIWVIQSLKRNEEFFSKMTKLQRNNKIMEICNKVDIRKCTNIRLLHCTNYVCMEIERYEYPHLFAKYSEEWRELVKECIVSDECIADCLGISGLKKLNEYVKTFLNQDSTYDFMDISSKSQYEIDGITTLARTFMPTLLLSCAVMYKEGCSFLGTNFYKKFLCVSPLCVIRLLLLYLQLLFKHRSQKFLILKFSVI